MWALQGATQEKTASAVVIKANAKGRLEGWACMPLL
jgi:hypothetical protein